MHNPAPVLENDTHKLLGDFDILTPNLDQKTRPYNNQQQKKNKKIKQNLQNCRLCCPG